MNTLVKKANHQINMTGLVWLRVRFFNAIAMISVWQARARQRRQLAQLEDHRLKDLGLTREEAMAQAAKPFWK